MPKNANPILAIFIALILAGAMSPLQTAQPEQLKTISGEEVVKMTSFNGW